MYENGSMGKNANTPFWLLVQEIDGDSWKISSNFQLKCKEIALQLGIDLVVEGDVLFMSLVPLVNNMEDAVVADMVEQIQLVHEKLVAK